VTTERQRELSRERMRRYRERIRGGRRAVTVELDNLTLGQTLAATGDIDPMRDDDPEELRTGLQRLLERLFARYA
jgi:hypothetical protein